MKKLKRFRKTFAIVMMVSLLMANQSLTVLADTADDSDVPKVGVEVTLSDTGSGTLEDPRVVVTQNTVDNTDGSNVVTTTIETAKDGVNENGAAIDYYETQTTIHTTDAEGNVTETNKVEGKETTTYENPTPDQVTVVVTPDAPSATESETPADPVVSGPDPQESPDDKIYNQTVTTEIPREVTAELEGVSAGEGNGTTDMTSSVTPDSSIPGTADNDINATNSFDNGSEKSIDSKEEAYNSMPEEQQNVNGYDYQLTDYGMQSAIRTWVTDPDGTFGYSNHQFELTDSANNKHTVYCADLATSPQGGYYYYMDNIEDGTYYSEKDAKNIRAIVNNGYWGTAEGEGSLEAFKDFLKDAQKNGDLDSALDIDAITDGEALMITQTAIWNFGNMETEKYQLNMDNPAANASETQADRIKAILDYMTTIKEDAGEETTIIDEKNFVDEVTLTVKEKATDTQGTGDAKYANNTDDNPDNDLYLVDMEFSMVVVPDAQKDDLIVYVYDGDGNLVRKARLAGDDSEDDDSFGTISSDGNGNYTLTDLELMEGVAFDLKLTGFQQLADGVYLYSSETIDGVSSQTFVGKASGKNAVDVGLKMKFTVKEGKIVECRTWRGENTLTITNSDDDSTTSEDSQDDDDDGGGKKKEEIEEKKELIETTIELEILDKEAQAGDFILATAPRTGDLSNLWLALTAVSAIGLAATFVLERKRRHAA